MVSLTSAPATSSANNLEGLTVFVEGINVLKEDQRIFGRYEEQMLRAQEGEARYAVGARFVW